MFRQNEKLIVGAIITMLMAVSLLLAEQMVPDKMNYQGRLLDANGNPVNGTKSITFNAFNDESGGALLWSETQTVEVTDGFFNVTLGSINPFNEIFLSCLSAHLVLKVEDDDDMSPRTKINSVLFALFDGDWKTSGDNLYSAQPGNVGIGTDTPTEKLHVDGGSGTAVLVESNGDDPTFKIQQNTLYRTALQVNGSSTFNSNSQDYSIVSNGTNFFENSTSFSTSAFTNSGGGTAVEANTYNTSMENGPTGKFTNSGNGDAVYGLSYNSGHGGYFKAGNGNNDDALYATTSGSGRAGYFNGDVHVNGNLSKSSGTFLIDHPYDPANKYLAHSLVESPDMMNVYNGNIILDNKGEAIVELPYYFENINMEFRYQLTPIGASAPDLYIAEEISNNEFKIAGGKSGIKVSWQITGIRNDLYAKKHRVQVERDKPDYEKGKYLNPELFGLGEEKGINYKPINEPKKK
ncbi:MAG: hypothetical protein K8S23_13185 [Candidatus Cloacimonetes bacterium]|nr:hypothetical protein [Candidatus Cloacimonadota bacterium]